MKNLVWLAAVAIAFGMVAFASDKVAELDGTSWKVSVVPDDMAKTKGEKEYKETITFANGSVSMTEGQKVGFASSSYDVTKSGDKDWTFKSEQSSDSSGRAIWTGTVHEKHVEGKVIVTRKGGAVMTYTFKGEKLD
ncbi:MAG TPA: hypothetical protein VFE84_09105 [Patescibacteria group bacterium]|jgi:hypothetical protein|nr:hypothetical protein [Patescibacteria group bacterium]